MTDEKLNVEVEFAPEGIDKVLSAFDGLYKKLEDIGLDVSSLSKETRGIEKAVDGLNATGKATGDIGKSARDSAKGVDEINNSMVGLSAQRYALYDVAGTFSNLSNAIGSAVGATVKASMDFETSFAAVERTSGAVGGAATKLKGELIDMTRSMNVSFEEISKIATSGAQMGIAANELSEFSDVVAKFAATSDSVNADQAAAAFGRIANLTGERDWAAMASGITLVGVNAAATEAQIIKTTQELAPFTTAMGQSASETVGLAAALASLGVPPERARSAISSLASTVDNAVAGLNDKLPKYAELLGRSNAATIDLWQTDPTEFVQSMARALGGVDDLTLTLDGLGLKEKRVSATFKALASDARISAGGVSVLDRAISDSNRGFEESTEIYRQYDIIAKTLSSRWGVFTNALRANGAAIGDAVVPAIAAAIDVATGLANALGEFAKSDVGQFLSKLLVPLGGAATAILALASAGLVAKGTTLALSLASSTLGASFARIPATAGAAGVSVGLFGKSVAISTVEVKALYSFLTGPWGLAMLAAGAGVAALGYHLDSLKNSSEEIQNVLKTTTDASKILDSVGEGRDAAWLRDVKADLADLGNVLNAAEDQAANFFARFDSSNFGAFASIRTLGDELATLAQTDLPAAQAAFASLVETNNLNEVQQARLLEMMPKYRDELLAQATAAGVAVSSLSEQEKAQVMLSLAQGKGEYAASALAASQSGIENAASLAAQAMEEGADSADSFTGSMKELKDAIDSAFADQNSMIGFAQSFDALIKGIYEGGNSFSVFEASGQVNLQNLQKSIVATVASAETLGINATEAVGALFARLKAEGVDTVKLLASLPGLSIPGVNMLEVQSYASGVSQLSAGGSRLADVMSSIATNSKRASGGVKKTGSSAKKAAAEVRTLTDYANDLSKVMSRSFEIRFGAEDISDSIQSTYNKLLDERTQAQEKAADAAQKYNATLREQSAEIEKLTSDKRISEYWLGIAEQYEDALRAGELRANIAKIDDKLAESSEKVADAQKDASKAAQEARDKETRSLQGNTQAAIDNRDTVRQLAQQYQDYISKLAASGASQATLRAETSRLQADFIRQATQLGFSRAELDKYTAAFGDARVAIDRVPRNITVAANVNPAIQALNEMAAQAARSGSSARDSVNSALGGIRIPNLPPISISTKIEPPTYGQLMDLQAQMRRLLNNPSYKIATGPGGQGGTTWFAEGGYTGRGGKWQEAGVVHKGEYVIPKQYVNQRTGTPDMGYVASLQGARQSPLSAAGYANGGYAGAPSTSGPMDLSANSIMALADALSSRMQSKLYMDGRQLSTSASAGDRALAMIGSN